MPSSTELKPNATRALEQAAQLIGASDSARLRTALLAAAAEELTRSPAFIGRVRALYNAAVPMRPSRSPSKWEQLMPINPTGDEHLDLFAPPDPYWILRVYGAAQLPIALHMFPLTTLKEACTKIEYRHPGSKPKNRGRTDDVIAYIVQQVTRDSTRAQ